MNTPDRLAFIGDVHGEAALLFRMLTRLKRMDLEGIVFLGDYVNRGSRSAEVIDLLVQASLNPHFTFLKGNHEQLLLDALDSDDLAPLLCAGGAATITSYLKRPASSNVLADLRAAIPEEHTTFLRGLGDRYEDEDVVASHKPIAMHGDTRYLVSAHFPAGPVPEIGPTKASIDTGSGLPGGRLTALLWPSRTFIQTRHG